MTSAPPTNLPAGAPASSAPSSVPPPATPTPGPRTIRRQGSTRSGARLLLGDLLYGTPGRMRLLGALAVLAALLLGATSVNGVLAAKAAVDRAASNTAQVVRVQSIHVDLLRADALATNAFLVGGLEPPDQRAAYDAALDAVVTGIVEASAAQPADEAALAALAEQVQVYSGLVQQARTNNRQGLPVGAQYLKEASAGLRADAVPIVGSLVTANEGRAVAEFNRAGSITWLIGGLIAIIGLVLVAVWLARATHRYLNPSLSGAIALLLVALFVALSTILSIGSTTSAVAGNEYRDAVALADVGTAANDARASESLTLIARGSGQASEKRWKEQAAFIDANLPDLPDIDAADWAAYTAAHEKIRKADNSGDWDGAVKLSTATTPGSAGAEFRAFDTSVTTARDDASRQAVSTLTGAGGNTPLFAILVAAITLVACWLSIRGFAQRIREYT